MSKQNAEDPDSDDINAGEIKEPESNRADEYESTQIIGDEKLDRTVPGMDGTAADSKPNAKTFAISEHERIHYFGDYELLEEIARGGMGVVYKARQTRLKRIVAIKMILGGQLASEKQIKRFLVEAEAAANLDHPGIVPVYEFGEHSGSHFFSMAFVDGPSLAEMVSESPLPPNEAAEILSKIAEAIAYAHGRGVVHRDLKPANVLIEQDGQPRITDFGLAKMIEADDELTQDGAIMGSIFYMPPEQAVGNKALIGPAADIYSLGAIFYKLLTGHPPFQAPTTMEILSQVVEQDPVPPRRINPRIPRDLETICLKCLQKDIGRRFDSADDLVDELERFRRGEPIRSRPISRWAYVWRWCRRNPLPASLAAGLCTALLIGVIVATTLLNRAQSEQRRFEEQQRTVEVLSTMVLSKTLDETDDWLNLFFQPVERELLVVRDWTREGVVDAEQPDETNQILGPLIEHYPQISSSMIADERGREHMLLCIKQQQTGTDTVSRQWKCRQTRRDELHDEVKWLEWSGNQRVNARVWSQQLDYDPRTRPWFQNAVSNDNAAQADASAQKRINWTEPYVFFTTKGLGITASMTTSHTGHAPTVKTVVAFDVLLEDITRFTIKKHPTPNGKVFVLTRKAELIGLANDPGLQTSASWKPLLLKHLSDLEQPYARVAADSFSFAVKDGTQIRRFESDGATWWGAARPFQLGERSLWILVLLPESDLHESLAGD